MNSKYLLLLLMLMSTILCSQQRVVFGENNRSRIFSMNPDGSDLQLVIGKTAPSDLQYNGNLNKLMFTDRNNGTIQRCNPDGSALETIVQNLDSPNSLTLGVPNGVMFWVERNQIFRSGLAGQNPTLIYEHSEDIIDITLDLMRGKTYFLSGDNLFQLMNGSGVTSLISDEVFSGREVEVDAELNKLFFIQNTGVGNFSGLFSISTDGSGLEKIETDTDFLEGMALDKVNGKIFYSTRIFDNVYFINYDGTEEEQLFTGFSSVPGPDEIAVDPVTETVFHTDISYRDVIVSSNYEGADKKTILESDVNRPNGLAYDKANDRLIYINGTNGDFNDRSESIFETNISGENAMLLFDQDDADDPQDIELDLTMNHVYFVNEDVIRRSDLDGSNLVDLYDDGDNKYGLALDRDNDMIYWYNSTMRTIQRGPMDGNGPVEILVSENLVVVTDIEVNLKDGKMYWVDDRENAVSRANLDGSDVENIMMLNSPPGIVVDEEAERIYVTSDRLIVSADLDGSNVQELNVNETRFAGPIILTEKTLSSIEDIYTNGISVFPNPVSETLNIVVDSDNTKFMLYDINGRLLEQDVLGIGLNKINLNASKEGAYFIHFEKANGHHLTSKIIKRK